jgi:hypothetical protein
LNTSPSASIDKAQRQLGNTPFVSLSRTTPLKWITQPINNQQQRFHSSVPSMSTLEPALSDLDTRIIDLAKNKARPSKVIDEFNASKHGSPLAPETYEAVVTSCQSLLTFSKPLTDMMGVYTEMKTQGILPTSTTYATLIQSLCAREEEVDRLSHIVRLQVGDVNSSAIGAQNLHKVLNKILHQNGKD